MYRLKPAQIHSVKHRAEHGADMLPTFKHSSASKSNHNIIWFGIYQDYNEIPLFELPKVLERMLTVLIKVVLSANITSLSAAYQLA